MAVYIDDAGLHGYDAKFVGVEDTAWSRDTTDECIWFSSTGTCETGFTLPDSEWIVYEVYGMTGTTADYTTLTGSTQLHGKKEYTTTIGTVLTTINAWRTAYDTSKGSDYTTYEIIATHYKGSDVADVYEADETTAFSTATITDGDYTGHGSEWILSDDLLADSVGSVRQEVYISYYSTTGSETPPAGVTINNYSRTDTAVKTPVDIDNVTSDYTVQLNSLWSGGTGGTPTSNESGCVSDYEMEEGMRCQQTSQGEIDIVLPSGTFEVTVSAFRNVLNTDYVADYTLNGTTYNIDANPPYDTDNCKTWTIVTTGDTYTLEVLATAYYGVVSSVRIKEV